MDKQTKEITEEFSPETIYTIDWEDIENTEPDYDFYLDEIESFFREDFENDIIN